MNASNNHLTVATSTVRNKKSALIYSEKSFLWLLLTERKTSDQIARMKSTKKLRHWEVVSSLNQRDMISQALIPWLPKLGRLPFKGDTELNTNVNNIPEEDQHAIRSFLFLCTIWKSAYISAATSPSRISLSLQLTISSQGLFVGWTGVPLHSVQFSRSVMSNSLQPHESQHARPPCPSPTPGVHSDLSPSSWWCHPAISSSVVPFSSCPRSLPASESFPMSQLFTWGGQRIGVSALASFIPKNTQGHKTQRKAPNRQNSRLPVANYFSMIFLPTSKVKNQNQHRETYKNMRCFLP